MTTRTMLNVVEFAGHIGKHRMTVYRWLESGRIVPQAQTKAGAPLFSEAYADKVKAKIAAK